GIFCLPLSLCALLLSARPRDKCRPFFGPGGWLCTVAPRQAGGFGVVQLALGKDHEVEPQRNSPLFIEQVRTFRHELSHMARVEIHQLWSAPMGAFEFPNQLNDVVPHMHTHCPTLPARSFCEPCGGCRFARLVRVWFSPGRGARILPKARYIRLSSGIPAFSGGWRHGRMRRLSDVTVMGACVTALCRHRLPDRNPWNSHRTDCFFVWLLGARSCGRRGFQVGPVIRGLISAPRSFIHSGYTARPARRNAPRSEITRMVVRILSIVFPLIVIAALGYFIGRRTPLNLVDANKLNMDVFLPALVFSALASKDFRVGEYATLALATFIVVIGSGLLGWAVARAAGIAGKTFVPPIMFNNCGNLGLPLAVLAFGEQALAPAVVMFVVSNFLHFSFGAWLLNHKTRLMTIWLVPSVFATILGLAVSAAG